MTQYKWNYDPLFLLTLGIFFDVLGIAIFIVGIATGVVYIIFFGLFIFLIFGLPGTIKGYKDYQLEKDKRNHTPQDEQRFMNYYLRTHPEYKKFFTKDKEIRIDLKPNPNNVNNEEFVKSLLLKYNIKNNTCGIDIFKLVSFLVSKANQQTTNNVDARKVAEMFFRRQANELSNMTFEDFKNSSKDILNKTMYYYTTFIDENYLNIKQKILNNFPFKPKNISIDTLKQDFLDFLDDALIEEIESPQIEQDDNADEKQDFLHKILTNALIRFSEKHKDDILIEK